MERFQEQEQDEAPPAYTRKPSLLPSQTVSGPAHERFLPDDEETSLINDPSAVLSPLAAEPPPGYTPLDESIHTFTARPPYIYATGSSTFPRYQVQAEYSRRGKPFRLRIRRLLGTESRRLSLSSRAPSGAHQRRSSSAIAYDDDMTLYTAENASGLGGFISAAAAPPATLDIRGRARGTLPGFVRLANEGRGRARVWHVTRNPRGDSLRAENERRMQRRGYKPQDEVRQALLFRVVPAAAAAGRKLDWRDERQVLVATESENGGMRIVGPVDVRTRDLLVTCWATKLWANCAEHWRDAPDAAGLTADDATAPLARAATSDTGTKRYVDDIHRIWLEAVVLCVSETTP